jgi:uncharacterized membrane protein
MHERFALPKQTATLYHIYPENSESRIIKGLIRFLVHFWIVYDYCCSCIFGSVSILTTSNEIQWYPIVV